LLGESVAVLLTEVHALDAFALETGVRLVQAEIDEETLFHGLWVVVEEGRHIGIAPEEPEGVTVDEARVKPITPPDRTCCDACCVNRRT
jgi:hypothetical protein